MNYFTLAFGSRAVRKSSLSLLTTVLLGALPWYSMAEGIESNNFVVVIKKTAETNKLERKDLRSIFMGTNSSREYRAVHLPAGHPLRITFNTKVIGLTESRIQSYWAQIQFTGRGKPPMELKSVPDIIKYLQTHDRVAAYLPANIELPVELAVIYP